ncbi:hypothetical protein DPQ33_16335 [Oceanidesulfovibrio indonesiensis]|uniref:DUF2190 family protein n=1 Tax=Oceanidesulfovibrio indonesiensis TaxID=54767 RepID=A0A7M3MAY3_9BACT|nr:capsid cement protein [Oceanidesulfovibrio indonesiensis]TVM15055.1 hypothetical protein DPQ33_16335 [Oceanidesulfovibrio indonesiensis]
MSYNDYGIGSHPTAQDIVDGRRVEFNASGHVVYAPATRLGVGVSRISQKSGEDIGVAYWNKPGTHHIEVKGAIDIGDQVFAAANGTVSVLPAAAGDYVKVGVALEASAEDGDVIEVLPVESGKIVNVAA